MRTETAAAYSISIKRPIVPVHADVLGGTPLNYLEADETTNDFLEDFRSVPRERVIAFFEKANDCGVAAAW